jgi:hypothetical protein
MICLNNSPDLIDDSCGTESGKPHEQLTCLHCKEPILESEAALPLNEGTAFMHRECMFRGVCGSVGHQMGQCMCHDIEDTSEVGLSDREAARRALAYWREHNPQLP